MLFPSLLELMPTKHSSTKKITINLSKINYFDNNTLCFECGFVGIAKQLDLNMDWFYQSFYKKSNHQMLSLKQIKNVLDDVTLDTVHFEIDMERKMMMMMKIRIMMMMGLVDGNCT